MSSPPLLPDTPSNVPSTPQQPKITRTVAIIKNHALSHRFDIEPRIQEASFEIVKERQMEFDVESDPDTLYELFGEDAESLGEGPVWVYVLERRRAVEVWNTLMGDRDPEVARQNAPNSLRALYSVSGVQNAVMGSPDDETAEIQIASLFASSPPFPTSDLPSDDGRFGTLGSVSSSVLSALQGAASDEGYARSSAPSTAAGSTKMDSNGSRRASFKARALPSTHEQPDIVPRTTRAADLRAGIAVPQKVAPRVPISKERMAQTFANVPGHKRAETISVASTAAPRAPPRMTKAAALRLGIQPPPTVRKTSSSSDTKATFDGVPGHKRRETIAVSSTAVPQVAPRTNRSAALRQQKDSAPPTSFMFRGPSEPKVPGLSRSNSSSSLHSRPPSARPPSRAPSSTGVTSRTTSRPPVERISSNASTRTNGSAKPNGNEGKASSASPPGTASPSKAAPKSRPRPSSISMPPTIAPRTNKSAALRAAKKEQEAQAAAAAAQRRAPGRAPRPPPSSMPTGLVV